MRIGTLDSYNPGKQPSFLSAGMIALILAFITFVILSFVFKSSYLLVMLIIKFWIWAIVIILIALVVKYKFRKKKQ